MNIVTKILLVVGLLLVGAPAAFACPGRAQVADDSVTAATTPTETPTADDGSTACEGCGEACAGNCDGNCGQEHEAGACPHAQAPTGTEPTGTEPTGTEPTGTEPTDSTDAEAHTGCGCPHQPATEVAPEGSES